MKRRAKNRSQPRSKPKIEVLGVPVIEALRPRDPGWHPAHDLLDNGDHRVGNLEELLGFGDVPDQGGFNPTI